MTYPKEPAATFLGGSLARLLSALNCCDDVDDDVVERERKIIAGSPVSVSPRRSPGLVERVVAVHGKGREFLLRLLRRSVVRT